MEQDVDDMEPWGPHPVQLPVEAQGQHCEGAVGLVRLRIGQGRPPKVVAEDFGEGCVTSAGGKERLSPLYTQRLTFVLQGKCLQLTFSQSRYQQQSRVSQLIAP